MLIYGELPVDEDQVNIDELTIELSGIIAQSKVNFSNFGIKNVGKKDSKKHKAECFG